MGIPAQIVDAGAEVAFVSLVDAGTPDARYECVALIDGRWVTGTVFLRDMRDLPKVNDHG